MNDKKNIIQLLLIIGLLFAVVICFTKINSLEREIDNVRNDYASEVSFLRSQLNSIYHNVDEQMKQQASLLSSVSYQCGTLDAVSRTVSVEITVVPKEITDDMKMSVAMQEHTAEFVREGNFYVADLSVDMFLAYDEHPLLTIKTAEGEKTEYLEDVHLSYLWTDYVPSLSVRNIQSSASYLRGGDSTTLDAEMEIGIKRAEKNSQVNFNKFMLIAKVNGVEVETRDITDEVLNSDTFRSNGKYVLKLEESYPAVEGDDLEVYVVAEDTLGYIHEYMAYHWYQRSGAQAETIYVGEQVYDAQGNLLFGKGY